MKLLDIRPNFLNEELARKICQNKQLKTAYIKKYDVFTTSWTTSDSKVRIF